MTKDRELRATFVEHMEAAHKAFPYHFGNWVRFYNAATKGAEYCIRCDTPHYAGDDEHKTDASMTNVFRRFCAKLLAEPQAAVNNDGAPLT